MFVQRYSNVAAILHLMSSGVKTPNMVFLIHFNRSYTVRSFYCCDKLERLYSDTKERKYDVPTLIAASLLTVVCYHYNDSAEQFGLVCLHLHIVLFS